MRCINKLDAIKAVTIFYITESCICVLETEVKYSVTTLRITIWSHLVLNAFKFVLASQEHPVPVHGIF